MAIGMLNKDNQFVKKTILLLSILIPVVVMLMLGIRSKFDFGKWTNALPLANAIVNSCTALLLLIGLLFIKQKNIRAHEITMMLALGTGAVFLVFYVLYHITHISTPYGDDSALKYFYYFILISHIVLAAVVLPFVLYAVYFALSDQIEKHKKTVRYAFPIWLYVSITGVLVYWMISPYYAF